MNSKTYQKCDESHVFNGRDYVLVNDSAVMPTYTVERQVVVSAAPRHESELLKLEVQASTPAQASLLADAHKHEMEAVRGHHLRRQGNRDACC